MLEKLKKWWKYLAAGVAFIVYLLSRLAEKRKWGEFHENSVKNLKAENLSEKEASEAKEEVHKKANEDFDKGLKELKEDIDKKKDLLKKKKEDFSSVSEPEVGKKISEELGIEYVKTKK